MKVKASFSAYPFFNDNSCDGRKWRRSSRKPPLQPREAGRWWSRRRRTSTSSRYITRPTIGSPDSNCECFRQTPGTVNWYCDSVSPTPRLGMCWQNSLDPATAEVLPHKATSRWILSDALTVHRLPLDKPFVKRISFQMICMRNASNAYVSCKGGSVDCLLLLLLA